jgi:hypothetical protein
MCLQVFVTGTCAFAGCLFFWYPVMPLTISWHAPAGGCCRIVHIFCLPLFFNPWRPYNQLACARRAPGFSVGSVAKVCWVVGCACKQVKSLVKSQKLSDKMLLNIPWLHVHMKECLRHGGCWVSVVQSTSSCCHLPHPRFIISFLRVKSPHPMPDLTQNQGRSLSSLTRISWSPFFVWNHRIPCRIPHPRSRAVTLFSLTWISVAERQLVLLRGLCRSCLKVSLTCIKYVAVQGGGAHGLSGTVVVNEHEWRVCVVLVLCSSSGRRSARPVRHSGSGWAWVKSVCGVGEVYQFRREELTACRVVGVRVCGAGFKMQLWCGYPSLLGDF